MSPHTKSTTIQRNADKLMAIIESERNNAVTALNHRLIDIEKHLVLLQNRLSNLPSANADTARELAGLQHQFTGFCNSSGILSANAARIAELEASLTLLQTDNYGLLERASVAFRDVITAREKEEHAKNTLDTVRNQLALIGMGLKDDGSLGFGPEWSVVLQDLGRKDSQVQGQINILSRLSLLATKLRNEGDLSKRKSSINDSHPDKSAEVINMVGEGSTTGPST